MSDYTLKNLPSTTTSKGKKKQNMPRVGTNEEIR